MNQLLKSVDESVVECTGWCSREKARTLALLVLALKPNVVVEIGVFAGKSAIPMALALKHLDHGEIVCIDPWENKAASEGYVGDNHEWWSNRVNMDSIYKSFMVNVVKFQVTKYMNIKREKSDSVTPPDNISLLHVDGSHTIQALKDVQRFAVKVIRGGVVVMDDIDWTNDGEAHVSKAVDWLKENGFMELFKIGTGAVYMRE